MAKKPSPKKTRQSVSFQIALRGRQEDDAIPQLAATAVDAKGKALEVASVGEDGKVRMSAKAFDRATRVLIGAAGSEPDGDAEFFTLHKFQVAKAIQAKEPVDLPRRAWLPFLTFRRCISGKARHCDWWHWLTEVQNTRFQRMARGGVVRLADRVVALDSVLEPVMAMWKRCKPLCEGVVEVYRRTCCCPPIVIFDPRIPEIIRELEELVRVIPPPPIDPPGPGPDPLPFREIPFLKGGAEYKRAINAEADLAAIKELPAPQQASYIQARPYLFCGCSSPGLVASGFIQPDGTFNICWDEPLRLMWIHCHDEFAFVIKQLVEDDTITIYDGVAAGQWFHSDDEITLTSYHADAIVCDVPSDPPPGATGTSVMLEAIRSTRSEHLNSPLPNGWDRVPAPTGNDGLAFPAPAAAPGVVQWKNVGWGWTLPLRYLFFDDLEPIATYYRISVVRANAAGAPVGPRTYLNRPLSWRWHRRRVDLTIKPESFDVGPVAGSSNLYRIPYRSYFQALLLPGEIGEWAFGQFHGVVDSRDFADDRHLVTIELFDAAQNQIKPATAPGSDPGTAAPFSFQAWDQTDLSATVPVHFGALTHLFWWDNRQTDARILAVRKGGALFLEECLFLDGPRNTTVSLDYRAKHDEPMFLYWHDVRWKRGLFTPWQTWVAANSTSVDPGTTPPRTYDQLLGTHDQCAFSLEVRTRAKITHGSGRILHYDDRDNGSIAIISPLP